MIAIITSSVISLILIVLGVAHYYLISNFDYWKKRGVKFAKPIPFFGNYYEIAIGKSDPASSVTEIARQFPEEKVIGIFQGRRPALIVRDPEIIRDITTKDFWYFSGRNPHAENFKMEMMDLNLFAIGGPLWKVVRVNFSPIFSSKKMKNMFYLLKECNGILQKFLEKQVKKSNVLNSHDVFSKFTMEAIGSCIFGLQVNNINEDFNQFRKIGHQFFKASPKIVFNSFFKSAMPSLSSYLSARDKEVNDFYASLSKKMIELRKAEGQPRHDIIDTLIKLLDKGVISSEVQDSNGNQTKFEVEVNHDLLAAQAFIFYAAGFETSSTAMTMTLFELAKNPEIQRKLATEIDEAMAKSNEVITYEMVTELTYLNMVLSEILRLYPALGTITRMSDTKYTFNDTGMTIDAGVLIHLAVKDIHHNPKYYPEPMKFDPERFSPENKDKIQPFTYLPFGEGPRTCIGMRFGKLQAQVGLIGTLSKYWIETCDETCEEIGVHPWSHIVTIPSCPVYLRFTPRKPFI